MRYSESYTAFAPFRPMIQVDWLVSKGFGLGLYMDWQIAKYGSVHTSLTPPDDPATAYNESVTNAIDEDIDIANPAFTNGSGSAPAPFVSLLVHAYTTQTECPSARTRRRRGARTLGQRTKSERRESQKVPAAASLGRRATLSVRSSGLKTARRMVAALNV